MQAGTVLKKWTVSDGSRPDGHLVGRPGQHRARRPRWRRTSSGCRRWTSGATPASAPSAPSGRRRPLAQSRASRAAFYPQDLDGLSRTDDARPSRCLRPMTVTWTLRNAAGQIVDTHLDAVGAAGGHRNPGCSRVADRRDHAADRPLHLVRERRPGPLSATQSVAFDAGRSSIKPSDTTAGPRPELSVLRDHDGDAVSRAPAVRLPAGQGAPGASRWSRPATNTYKAIITLKTGGSSGTVTLQGHGGGLRRPHEPHLEGLPLH